MRPGIVASLGALAVAGVVAALTIGRRPDLGGEDRATPGRGAADRARHGDGTSAPARRGTPGAPDPGEADGSPEPVLGSTEPDPAPATGASDAAARADAVRAWARSRDPDAVRRIVAATRDPEAAVRCAALEVCSWLVHDRLFPAHAEAVLEATTAGLADPDAAVRAYAARVAATFPDGLVSRILPAILRAVGDGHSLVAERAIAALAHAVGEDAGVRAALVACYPDASPQVRSGIVAVLAGRGEIASLATLLDGAHAADRVQILGAIEQTRAKTPEVSRAVRRLLDDPDPAVRAAAATCAGSIGDAEAVPALVALLAESGEAAVPGASVRLRAVTALGRSGKAAAGAAPALARILEAGDPSLVLAAIDALASVGPAGDPFLITTTRAADPHHRARALTGLGWKAPRSPAALAAIRASLQDPDRSVRWAATESLASWPDSEAEATTCLLGWLDDPDRRVDAVNALGALGPAAASALPALRAIRPEPESLLDFALRDSLSRIGD